jgi:hypothetical protein
MSTPIPPVTTHRTHRHTRSAVLSPPAATSHNPQSPHHFNLQSHGSNSQLAMDQPFQPTTPPRTPRKADNNASTTSGPQMTTSDNLPKPRSKGRGRPKSVTTSPAVPRNARNTPPLTGSQAGISQTSARPIPTPTATAYAGPTFHASPAPSTLPIPSFYSKSVPDSPSMRDLQTRKEETSSNGSDSPTPPSAPVVAAQPREESPLDFFFKADREEKARARSAGSFHDIHPESGPFPPPTNSSQPITNTPLPGTQGRNRNAHFSGGSTSALFAMELDGTNSPGKPIGPAFSTPYNERMNAARSSAAARQSSPQVTQEQPQSKDLSEALKAYLFSPPTQGSPTSRPLESSDLRPSSAGHSFDAMSRNTSISYSGHGSAPILPRQYQNNFSHLNDYGTSRHSPRAGSRSSGLRQEITPTTTPSHTPERAEVSYQAPLSPTRGPRYDLQSNTRNSGGNTTSFTSTSQGSSIPSGGLGSGSLNSDLTGMEDSLRRMLKIDPVVNGGVSGSGIGSMPAASVSVPNYVGSRPPPMNGLHNGVMGS